MQKTKRMASWKKLMVGLLVIIGISLLMYPIIATFMSSMVQTQAIDGYLSDVAAETSQEIDAQIQDAREYNDRLLNSSAIMTDPFSMEAFKDALEGYNDILKINDTGMMGYLDIPSINVHLPIYHGTGSYALQHGVGHLETTSIPVGGENTHAVLSAHSGLTNATMFDDLPQMVVGDRFSISILNQTLTYEVYAIETVLPDQTESLNIQLGRDLVTLVTCTPYGINTHRLLVHGERIDPEPNTDGTQTAIDPAGNQQEFLSTQSKMLLLSGGAVLTLILITVIILLLIRRKRRN